MSSSRPAFVKDGLSKEIALRGMTQKEFAAAAGLDEATILKAIRGKGLLPQTWGKILIALGAIPKPEIPADLAERSA